MEKDDFLNDDFLRELILQSPSDSPSDDFVARVMAGVESVQQSNPAPKSYTLYIKNITPYLLLSLLLILVVSTSDIPFLNWFPGKYYYLNNLLPYFATLFSGLKNAFSSKYVSFGMLVFASAGLLFVVDRLLSRKTIF